MMKTIRTMILIWMLLCASVLPCFAAEDNGASEDVILEINAAPADSVADVGGTAGAGDAPAEPPTETVPSPEDQPDLSDADGEIPLATASPRLALDNENVYEGMDKAYRDGYVPAVQDGILTLVVPLIADGALKDDKIVVTPNLGDPVSSPFIYKNYQKTFYLSTNPVNRQDGAENAEYAESWLVRFELPLRADRSSGTWPILLDVQAVGEDGAAVQQSFTCYVTITDGVVTGADAATPAAVIAGAGVGAETGTPGSQPRVLVRRYTVSASPVTAGDEFTVVATLWNTSETQRVQNMVVAVSCDSENLVLKNESSTIYIGELAPGGSTDVALRYGADPETPAQRYGIRLTMEYDNSDAVTLSSAGSLTVEVVQPLRVELSPFHMASEVDAGETLELAFQVMNLGRSPVYNVHLALDVPGLDPVGSAFIGDMQGGTAADMGMKVFVGTKDEGERYGFTAGSLRLIYEDAGGTAYEQETEVSTTIRRLVIDDASGVENGDEPARASQWWISLIIGGSVIAVLASVFAGKRAGSP